MLFQGERYISRLIFYIFAQNKSFDVMEYGNVLKKFEKSISETELAQKLDRIKSSVRNNMNGDVYRTCFSCLDLTSLGSTDTHTHIEQLTLKAVDFNKHFPNIPNVASICVYPVFVETVGLVVGSSNMAITSVAGGFPSSQTYLEVKMLETSMAVENGADEIDVVLSLGEFLSGEYDLMGNEIAVIKSELGDETVLKVIIESGLLKKPQLIRNASIISMAAGADFIKTSTGKTGVAATPEAAIVICEAIRDYYQATGHRIGFKAAGGISSAEDAVLYYTIVKDILGDEWTTPDYFRIGASSLANNLLSAIENREVKYF